MNDDYNVPKAQAKALQQEQGGKLSGEAIRNKQKPHAETLTALLWRGKTGR
jgi:hypothetical protein